MAIIKNNNIFQNNKKITIHRGPKFQVNKNNNYKKNIHWKEHNEIYFHVFKKQK